VEGNCVQYHQKGYKQSDCPVNIVSFIINMKRGDKPKNKKDEKRAEEEKLRFKQNIPLSIQARWERWFAIDVGTHHILCRITRRWLYLTVD
jgi:hypothetical protein